MTSVRLSPALLDGLRAAARANDLTVSDVLRVAAEHVGAMSPEEFRAFLACPECGGTGRRYG